MSEREELARVMLEAAVYDGRTWGEMTLNVADAVLAHLREQGWVSDDTVQAVIRRAEQAERERDALQAECQRLQGLADLPGEHVNPLPAIVADYQARVRAEVKAGRVPIKPSH